MDLHLKGKKVFISGSTKGIGFETARLFLEEGATAIINGRTKKSVEVANTILYFSSPLASGTNGASIRVDGGSMGSII